jgi:hypothetical protein
MACSDRDTTVFEAERDAGVRTAGLLGTPIIQTGSIAIGRALKMACGRYAKETRFVPFRCPRTIVVASNP